MKTKDCCRCQRPFARDDGFETHQASGGGLVFVCWPCYRRGLKTYDVQPSDIGELHMRFAMGHLSPLEAAKISEEIKRWRKNIGRWNLIEHFRLYLVFDIAICVVLFILARHVYWKIFNK